MRSQETHSDGIRHHIAGHSDMGPRERLEDVVGGWGVRCELPVARTGSVLLVLDGVGGEHGGHVASGMGLHHIRASLAPVITTAVVRNDQENLPPDFVLSVLRDALVRANRAILSRKADEPQFERMATTAVAAILLDGALYLGWAGDSRCYLFRDDEMKCLTRLRLPSQRPAEPPSDYPPEGEDDEFYDQQP